MLIDTVDPDVLCGVSRGRELAGQHAPRGHRLASNSRTRAPSSSMSEFDFAFILGITVPPRLNQVSYAILHNRSLRSGCRSRKWPSLDVVERTVNHTGVNCCYDSSPHDSARWRSIVTPHAFGPHACPYGSSCMTPVSEGGHSHAHQPPDREGVRVDDPPVAPAEGGSGDRVMDRRAFLGTLAGGFLAAPVAAEAQPAVYWAPPPRKKS